MQRILVVIDMQNDFITGKLPADGGAKIVPCIVDKIGKGSYDEVIFTKDTHYTGTYQWTLEGKKIPMHCIYQGEGWNIIPEILEAAAKAKSVKGISIVNKEIFGSYDKLPEEIEKEISSPIWKETEIELCGVCTDICVVSNALILRAAFPNVCIKVDASCCAGTSHDAHKAALMVMKNCLIDVINE